METCITRTLEIMTLTLFDKQLVFHEEDFLILAPFKCFEIIENANYIGHCFYPRPVLASRYCRCLCLCVCVYQSLACPHDNLSPVQARFTKFGPEKQNTLVKIPIVLGGD